MDKMSSECRKLKTLCKLKTYLESTKILFGFRWTEIFISPYQHFTYICLSVPVSGTCNMCNEEWINLLSGMNEHWKYNNNCDFNGKTFLVNAYVQHCLRFAILWPFGNLKSPNNKDAIKSICASSPGTPVSRPCDFMVTGCFIYHI